MREAEDRFNVKYRYPWMFLNEEPFTEEFKRQGFLVSFRQYLDVRLPQTRKYIDECTRRVWRHREGPLVSTTMDR